MIPTLSGAQQQVVARNRQQTAHVSPAAVSNHSGTSIESAFRAFRDGARNDCNRSSSYQHHFCFSLGYRSMNTKFALSAIVAALMLTACAKQETAATAPDAIPPAPAASEAAKDANQAAGAAGQAAADANQAASQANQAGAEAKEGANAPPP